MLFAPLLFVSCVSAAVTIHYAPGQGPLGTASAEAASYTGAAAYNPLTLNPPGLPNPMPNQNYDLFVPSQSAGASIAQQGSFFGFSIEMSVANQVLGRNSSHISVPFLNLMGNLVARSGTVRVRVGGNTQETAVIVDSLPDGKFMQKDITQASNPTLTPPLDITPDLFYMMRNISEMVHVNWFLGIPFNDTSNWRLRIVTEAEAIVGPYLLGFQAGNEPDFYARHGHRPQSYGPSDYLGEVSTLIQTMQAQNLNSVNMLIGPNIASGDWTLDQVFQTGFLDAFAQNLAFVAVEHYPNDNCFAQFGVGQQKNPQDEFPKYLDHNAGTSLLAPFLNSTGLIQSKGKPFLMFETNTASCGGFAGISDSFGAALWGLDYALTMAHNNFSGALFHIGGQNVFYNPFTPPPTNQSTFHQWTIGPLYYSALVMTEVLGSTNSSQVLDLNANEFSLTTPAYAIYENGAPARIALVNFMTSQGGTDARYTAKIQIPGFNMPGSVKVKYLLAPSVSTKGNFTWAGQTFGDHFASDGRPVGQVNITDVPCNGGICAIDVPAPAFALVFLNENDPMLHIGEPQAQKQGDNGKPGEIQTYSTSAFTRYQNTATMDPQVLATSNGNSGGDRGFGSTSRGSSSDAVRPEVKIALTLTTIALAGFGGILLLR